MTIVMFTSPESGCSNPIHTPQGGGVLERRLVPFSFTHVNRSTTMGGRDGVESFSSSLKSPRDRELPMALRPGDMS
jgi:hypothetical protein